MVINHPLSASSVYYDPWYPLCSIYGLTVFFHNLISSVSIFCPILCSKILSTTFHSMFQQFNSSVRSTLLWVPFAFVNTTLYFQSSGMQLFSQYHYIYAVSTEFQYSVWFVSSLLLTLTSLGFMSFDLFQCCSNFIDHDAICQSLLLQQLPYSTTMFAHHCMELLTVHM